MEKFFQMSHFLNLSKIIYEKHFWNILSLENVSENI